MENRDQMDRADSSENSGSKSKGSRRGFAAMSPERQRQIASKGGRTAHAQGVAHRWSPEEAREAGRKGGQSSRSSSGRQS